jgi:hypothetical protein
MRSCGWYMKLPDHEVQRGYISARERSQMDRDRSSLSLASCARMQWLYVDVVAFASREASFKVSALVVISKEGTMRISKNKNILISGASIAGPTLAYWLKRYGFTPTVIERAPQMREGGYPIDVRNEAV